jgi:hypothetical protein
MSRRGLFRVFDGRHEIRVFLRKNKIEVDRIEIHWCQTDTDAALLEQTLIRSLKPRLNGRRGRLTFSRGYYTRAGNLHRKKLGWRKPSVIINTETKSIQRARFAHENREKMAAVKEASKLLGVNPIKLALALRNVAA